jgi:hypothetical protein
LASLKSLPAYSELLGDDDCVLDGIFAESSVVGTTLREDEFYYFPRNIST